MQAIKKVKAGPSREAVIEMLLEQILSGELKTMQPIPTETEITKQASVSRTVVREAIHSLKAKGILSPDRGRGTVVQHFHDWNHLDPDVVEWVRESRLVNSFLEHVLEIRLIIEPEAAALAAMRASTSDMLKIEDALRQMETAIDIASEESIKGDIMFHQAILKASDNMILTRFTDLFSAAIEMSIQITFEKAPDIELTLKRHRALFEAIYLRDYVAAKKKAFAILEQSAKDFKELKIPVRPDSLFILGR
ncbi:MAG: FadR/GntR family transcriptional regulator [Alphaproteobacteria bacterium]